MKNLSLSLFMLILGSAQVMAASLSGGEQFSAQMIEGRLSVQCSNSTRTDTGYANCRSQILNPAEYSFFIGPQIDADHVSLVATREDGSVSKVKTEEYDGVKAKSKKSFNLWISTVFQRPLLGFGKNDVAYTLTKQGKIVEQGHFNVQVVDGGRSVCQRVGYYYSSDINDCTMASNLCGRYFNENNYCQ